MRYLLSIILWLGWGAWAEEVRTPPPAQLFVVSSSMGFYEIHGVSELLLVDSRSPSCSMVFARKKYLEKQIQEIESSADRGETAELLEFRNRLLQLQTTLSRPWAKLNARFPIEEEVVQAIADKKFGVGFDLSTRSWVSRAGFLPEDVQLKVANGHLHFSAEWDAYQYCKWTSGLTLRIDLP